MCYLSIGSFSLLVIFYILYIDRALVGQMIKNVGPFNSFRAPRWSPKMRSIHV